jgi:hypothetical protein
VGDVWGELERRYPEFSEEEKVEREQDGAGEGEGEGEVRDEGRGPPDQQSGGSRLNGDGKPPRPLDRKPSLPTGPSSLKRNAGGGSLTKNLTTEVIVPVKSTMVEEGGGEEFQEEETEEMVSPRPRTGENDISVSPTRMSMQSDVRSDGPARVKDRDRDMTIREENRQTRDSESGIGSIGRVLGGIGHSAKPSETSSVGARFMGE